MPDMSRHNVGILTGGINNEIVLDVAVKDNGLKLCEDYILNAGQDIDTVKVRTPSNGYHYYFESNAQSVLPAIWSSARNQCQTKYVAQGNRANENL